MAKLILTDACYNGLKNVQKCKGKNKPEHEYLVKEANMQIRENMFRYMKVYNDAKSYLG